MEEFWTVAARQCRGQSHRKTVEELASLPVKQANAMILTIADQNPNLNVDILLKDVNRRRQAAGDQAVEIKMRNEKAPRVLRMVVVLLLAVTAIVYGTAYVEKHMAHYGPGLTD